eukprot:TRINITY_DN5674_c0_g1_i1.p1 TRINITY_DN5674_c0_g1~~TRINITY_DN5674_c0_g1_i1.p1  ORF type:complete len:923 (-),score=180.04 TRINITY_DN5674_c0_g1_i1:300-3068(-)
MAPSFARSCDASGRSDANGMLHSVVPSASPALIGRSASSLLPGEVTAEQHEIDLQSTLPGTKAASKFKSQEHDSYTPLKLSCTQPSSACATHSQGGEDDNVLSDMNSEDIMDVLSYLESESDDERYCEGDARCGAEQVAPAVDSHDIVSILMYLDGESESVAGSSVAPDALQPAPPNPPPPPPPLAVAMAAATEATSAAHSLPLHMMPAPPMPSNVPTPRWMSCPCIAESEAVPAEDNATATCGNDATREQARTVAAEDLLTVCNPSMSASVPDIAPQAPCRNGDPMPASSIAVVAAREVEVAEVTMNKLLEFAEEAAVETRLPDANAHMAETPSVAGSPEQDMVTAPVVCDPAAQAESSSISFESQTSRATLPLRYVQPYISIESLSNCILAVAAAPPHTTSDDSTQSHAGIALPIHEHVMRPTTQISNSVAVVDEAASVPPAPQEWPGALDPIDSSVPPIEALHCAGSRENEATQTLLAVQSTDPVLVNSPLLPFSTTATSVATESTVLPPLQARTNARMPLEAHPSASNAAAHAASSLEQPARSETSRSLAPMGGGANSSSPCDCLVTESVVDAAPRNLAGSNVVSTEVPLTVPQATAALDETRGAEAKAQLATANVSRKSAVPTEPEAAATLLEEAMAKAPLEPATLVRTEALTTKAEASVAPLATAALSAANVVATKAEAAVAPLATAALSAASAVATKAEAAVMPLATAALTATNVVATPLAAAAFTAANVVATKAEVAVAPLATAALTATNAGSALLLSAQAQVQAQIPAQAQTQAQAQSQPLQPHSQAQPSLLPSPLQAEAAPSLLETASLARTSPLETEADASLLATKRLETARLRAELLAAVQQRERELTNESIERIEEAQRNTELLRRTRDEWRRRLEAKAIARAREQHELQGLLQELEHRQGGSAGIGVA